MNVHIDHFAAGPIPAMSVAPILGDVKETAHLHGTFGYIGVVLCENAGAFGNLLSKISFSCLFMILIEKNLDRRFLTMRLPGMNG